MKYFVIQGTLKISGPVDEKIMSEHIAHSQKAMDAGLILVSGLKSDMSGGLSIMKANSINEVEDYLLADPLKIAGIQEYSITEFTPHAVQSGTNEWFKN